MTWKKPLSNELGVIARPESEKFAGRLCVVLAMAFFVAGFPRTADARSISLSEISTPPPVEAGSANIRDRDETYAAGENVYFGRGGRPEITFCVSVVKKGRKYVADPKDPNRLAISKKTMRAFNKEGLLTFLNSVFDCDKPKKLAFKYYEGEDFWHLLYYFNVRYGLKLKDPRLKSVNEKLR